MIRPMIVSLLVLVPLAGASADSGIAYVGQIECAAPVEASTLMIPDGSGHTLDHVRAFGGIPVDATIRVQLVDANYDPVPFYPAVDIWLQFDVEPGSARGCHPASEQYPGGIFNPDADTDADGWTEWRQPLLGGGWSEGPVTVYLNGAPAVDPDLIPHPPVDLRTNSPDLSGDLAVNLTDITLFTWDFWGDYHYRSDLYWDGVVNLSDMVFFVQGLGANCP